MSGCRPYSEGSDSTPRAVNDETLHLHLHLHQRNKARDFAFLDYMDQPTRIGLT